MIKCRQFVFPLSVISRLDRSNVAYISYNLYWFICSNAIVQLTTWCAWLGTGPSLRLGLQGLQPWLLPFLLELSVEDRKTERLGWASRSGYPMQSGIINRCFFWCHSIRGSSPECRSLTTRRRRSQTLWRSWTRFWRHPPGLQVIPLL